jgi:TATA-box binding protein (TBP) (component of TFIID and TFIIIB)
MTKFLQSDQRPAWISRATFEPEMFPGMCIHVKGGKAVVLIFASGKGVITGFVAENEIHTLFQQLLYPTMTRFNKGLTTTTTTTA